MTKFFQFNVNDYDTSIAKIQQSDAFFNGKIISMGSDNATIEYNNDQQIVSLFFQMQVNKTVPEPLPELYVQPTKGQRVFDLIGAVAIIIGAIAAAIYFLN